MRASLRSLPLIALPSIIVLAASGCSDDPTRVAGTQPTVAAKPFIRTAGSTVHDESHDVAVDGSGNVFVVGAANGAIDFGGVVSDPVNAPVFVARYDPAGDFQWVKRISGAIADGPLRLGTDNRGDVFLQGDFGSHLTFDGTPIIDFGGAENVFVMRLSPAGDLRWTSYDSAGYLSVGFGMQAGPTGGTAVTGFFQAEAIFGDHDLKVSGFDFYVVRYDPNGNVLWTKQTGADTKASGAAVAIDAEGNTIVAGSFSQSFTLDGVTLTADAGDGFIVKFDAAGRLQWLKSIVDGAENIIDVATDNVGFVYVCGRAATNVIWKLDPDGHLLWQAPAVSAADIAVDYRHEILLSGSYRGTLTVGADEVTSNGFSDFFIAKYGPSGQGLSVVSGGAAQDDRATGLAVDRYGHPVAVADYSESFEFGGETITSRGDQDVLIMRLE